MKISTKGRYALRLMLDLAIHQADGPVSLKTISIRQGVTVKYLEQIVPCLSRAGYLKSFRGVGGGYQLAKHHLHRQPASQVHNRATVVTNV